jgi:hypothetical protein
LAAITSLSCAACAIDNHGAVIGRITHADGAVVADIYAIGVHLKTMPGDTGLVLGYSRSSYVFAETPEWRKIAEGWHAFKVPMPNTAPNAMHIEVGGASAGQNSNRIGVTLGYRGYTMLARASAASNDAMSIRYRPAEPSKTKLILCKEITRCPGFY